MNVGVCEAEIQMAEQCLHNTALQLEILPNRNINSSSRKLWIYLPSREEKMQLVMEPEGKHSQLEYSVPQLCSWNTWNTLKQQNWLIISDCQNDTYDHYQQQA